jgi:transcription initiation factor TFIIIB Brf1 subunit/transcription initiation factor TFIIB
MGRNFLENEIQKKLQQVTRQNAVAAEGSLTEQKNYGIERLSSKKVLLYASKLWKDKLIAEFIAAETSKIIETVCKKRIVFFSGKSAKGVLSGIFYLLGRRNKAKKTQREIARSLNTNDVTVRDSYREWLDAFPDLFSTGDSIWRNVETHEPR